jgi:hypothetical protein
VLEDFYGPEDAKVTYCKVLKSMPEQQNARLKSYEITPEQ